MKKVLSLCCVLCLLLCAGCAPVQAENVQIAASFYPIYILAQNVLADVEGVTLTCMAAPSTGCLHDYQLLTSDMRTLSGASALIINGAGMETFLDDIQGQFPGLPIVDCSKGVELLGEEGADEHHHEDHDHGDYNAHIWLSPVNAIQMVENMAEALAGILPEKAEQIRENARNYQQTLTELHLELTEALALLPQKKIVTFHEAFPYFAREYGLEVVAVVALEPDEPLSPKMLARVVQSVRDAGNPPLFSEPQYANAALQAVSQETGAPVYELDPLVTGDGEKTAYQDVMRKNLTVLQQALGQ